MDMSHLCFKDVFKHLIKLFVLVKGDKGAAQSFEVNLDVRTGFLKSEKAAEAN